MSGDFISREAAKDAIYKTADEYDEYDKCDRIAIIALNNADDKLNDIPAADVVEVRHGRWCVTDAYPHNVYCSQCYKSFAQEHWEIWQDGSLPRDYCPSCGAKMDGTEPPKEETPAEATNVPRKPYDLLYEEGGPDTR